MKKLSPQVFKRAAEMIALGDEQHCCTAINSIENHGEHFRFFVDAFKPPGVYKCDPWWGYDLEWVERFEARILALLLCAEMCKR